MFAQCPQCEAIFRVSDEQIAAANGNVRCGQCLTIFDATEHPREDLLERNTALNGDEQHRFNAQENNAAQSDWHISDDEPLFASEPALEQDADDKPEEDSEVSGTSFHDDNDELQAYDVSLESTPRTDGETRSDNKPEPGQREIPTVILQDLQDARAARQRPSSVPWLLGSIVLVLLLATQAIYFKRHELGRDPQLRPWLTQACDLIGCRIAAPYDIKAIELIGLDVRSHPEAANALVASTVIINNASFIQPYPLLTLTFSDITGSRVAQRRFTPEEYLHTEVKPEDGMTPNLPVKIELELADPGAEAINFEFHLLSDPRNQQPGSN